MMRQIQILIALILVLSGCTKIEHVASQKDGIGYVVAVGTTSRTRATVVGTTYPTTESFVSSAYYLSSGFWATNKDLAVPYIDNLVVSYQGSENVWRNTSSSYYWPQTGSLTFFAYSPVGIGASISKEGVSLPNYNVSANPGKDFMVAEVASDQRGNSANVSGSAQNGVPTVFSHKLARVVVKAMLEETPTNPTLTYAIIKSVKFSNIYTTGSYGTDDIWSPDKTSSTNLVISSSDIIVNSSSSTLISANADGTLVLPQRHDSKTVKSCLEIEYQLYNNGTLITDKTGSDIFSVTLDDLLSTSWYKNSFITYNLTLSTDYKPITFSTYMEDWSNGTGDLTITD